MKNFNLRQGCWSTRRQVAFSLLFVFSVLLSVQSAFAYYIGMSANLVVGQQNFTSNTSGLSQTGIAGSAAVFVDSRNRLIVADVNNNRVLIWNNVPSSNGAPADLVLGQNDFVTGSNDGAGATATSFHFPSAVFSDGTKLFVADSQNRRVLIWNEFPTSINEPADVVVGQADFTTVSTTCNSSTTSYPFGVSVYNGKLVVSDRDQDRLLIWNSIPTSNGVSADVVLGQPNFDTCTGTSISANTITRPRGIAVDANGRLYAADQDGNRVLVWNSIPNQNNPNADLVVGQTSLTTGSSGLSSSNFSGPLSISAYGTRLFIADNGNKRVLVFNSLPTTSGVSADMVVGQQNFTSNSSNCGGSTGQYCFSGAFSVFASNGQLFVNDSGNFRVLVFDNVIEYPGLTLNNSPEGRENNQVRLSGRASVDSPYTVKTVQYSVNGSGFSSATASDGSFDETSDDFYFDFDPKTNQPKDNNGALIDGYTIQVKATNNNTDVTDHLFYFSPFNLDSPADNTNSTTGYPSFEFSVNKQRTTLRDNLDSYRVLIKKDDGSDWQTLIDGIPVDFRSAKNNDKNLQKQQYGNLDTNNGVYETEDFYATYSNDSSSIKVYSKKTTLTGSNQWKVVAVDKSGHTQETGSRKILINTASSGVINSSFPLAVLNISGLGNPLINSYNLTGIKSVYATSSLAPVFYGIAWSGSTVKLSLSEQNCNGSCTKEYSSVATQDSRWGINIPKGDMSYGKKYDTTLSVSKDDKYTQLPQFALSIGQTKSAKTSPAEDDQELSAEPTPSPATDIQLSSPTPSKVPSTPKTEETKKRCFWFVCW